MDEPQPIKQREMMRRLYQQLGPDKEKVCRAYAETEKRGEVIRSRNAGNNSPEQYAADLWTDGIRKGWLKNSD